MFGGSRRQLPTFGSEGSLSELRFRDIRQVLALWHAGSCGVGIILGFSAFLGDGGSYCWEQGRGVRRA
jgi:hypothetical protein